MKPKLRPVSALGALALLSSSTALASSALEYPDNGVAQFSRGGAWLATATDPIAAHYNPAALATQPTSFQLGFNLAFQKICFERVDEQGQPTSYGQGGINYPETCNSNAGRPNLIPNLSFAWRASSRLGIGLSIVPPSSYGKTVWPDVVSVPERAGPVPAPQRYLSLVVDATVLFPTLGFGYAITDDLRVGAGFIAGVAIVELQAMSMGQVNQASPTDDASFDTRSKITAKDLFVPGFVVSGHYSATRNLDFGVFYRFIDQIKAKGDLEVLGPYFTGPPGFIKRRPCAGPTDTNCAPTTSAPDRARVTVTIPMEARAGVRWHMPQREPTALAREKFRVDPYPTRDPLRDDLYDLELDLTWANNSAADNTQVRFPGSRINVISTGSIDLGQVPQNADRPTGYRDSFGARLGGQYALIRNTLGVRLGTWLETSAQDEAYLTVTGVPALRGGFGGGAVFRLGAVDVEAGYQHMWNSGLDNGGAGKARAIASAGVPTPPADSRSYHAVNGGKVSQRGNVVALGVVGRF